MLAVERVDESAFGMKFVRSCHQFAVVILFSLDVSTDSTWENFIHASQKQCGWTWVVMSSGMFVSPLEKPSYLPLGSLHYLEPAPRTLVRHYSTVEYSTIRPGAGICTCRPCGCSSLSFLTVVAVLSWTTPLDANPSPCECLYTWRLCCVWTNIPHAYTVLLGCWPRGKMWIWWGSFIKSSRCSVYTKWNLWHWKVSEDRNLCLEFNQPQTQVPWCVDSVTHITVEPWNVDTWETSEFKYMEPYTFGTHRKCQ